ncbi:hypothetical protein AMTR_s00085p00125770 [Amborella trichopoda]|uniref:Uncharacterized protein n=1 Tax=Amborella trichopoda TaxID=13333 RepID=W1P501_AMBTC|nr:hypothetical protein AMTR_s00085p00125770 [Amborella trichopoda]
MQNQYPISSCFPSSCRKNVPTFLCLFNVPWNLLGQWNNYLPAGILSESHDKGAYYGAIRSEYYEESRNLLGQWNNCLPAGIPFESHDKGAYYGAIRSWEYYEESGSNKIGVFAGDIKNHIASLIT